MLALRFVCGLFLASSVELYSGEQRAIYGETPAATVKVPAWPGHWDDRRMVLDDCIGFVLPLFPYRLDILHHGADDTW